MSNIDFFNKICEQQILKDALAKYQFLKPKPYGPEDGVRNDGLKFEKRSWFLPATGDRVERVCIHYESTDRGHFCVHVEIDPYAKGKTIKLGDSRLISLAFELRSKANLLQAIRERIVGDLDILDEISPSTKQLLSTEKPNANAAVKFDKLDKDSTVEECAEFFAHVITLVTPIIDELIAEHLKDRANWQ